VVDGDPDKSVRELALEVLAGKWGNGMDRKNRLHAAGYDYAAVQAEVNGLLQAEKPAQHISDRGLKLIQKYEGCQLKAYHLAGETYYTIGWGHHGPDVLPNMTISQEAADELLRMDLVRYEAYVKHCVTDITLTQCRLDALVSYCYNRGPGKLKDELAANCHTVQEYSAGIVKYWGSAVRYKDALLKRRREEQALFDGN
jgi:GH24 family phage-related lysozyme (muramidase)